MNRDGTEQTNLTENPAGDFTPAGSRWRRSGVRPTQRDKRNEMNGKVRTNEQGLRTLDQMDKREVANLLTELMARMGPEEEYELRHEYYVMEMPQSGERIRGREKMREFQEAYPNPPTIRLRRVIVRENLWVGEAVSDYGGQVFHTAAITELRDGKMWRDTRYYAEPFEAPGWRAQWVERMEPGEPHPAPARSKPIVERRNDPDEREIKRLVDRQWEKVRAGDFAGAHEIYADDCVVEWPQSGERIRGKENLGALREAYPARVEFELRRVIVRRDLCVSEYVIRYDGKPINVLSIIEFEDAKIVRETHYFADPFPPPEWRARWVERMEAGREGRLMDIQIRLATEADEATIKSMVRVAHLVPTNLHWSRFLIAEDGGASSGCGKSRFTRVAREKWPREWSSQSTGGGASAPDSCTLCSTTNTVHSTCGVKRNGHDTTNGSVSTAWSQPSYQRIFARTTG
jgi:hypothetical protein